MLSAKTVAQKPCDNVIPTLPPGHADADIIMGGGASAARAADADRQASRKRDVLDIIATPAKILHKRGKADQVSSRVHHNAELMLADPGAPAMRRRSLTGALSSGPAGRLMCGSRQKAHLLAAALPALTTPAGLLTGPA